MIRSILVALDDSPRAPGVLASAAEIAARFGARMHLLRVVAIPPELPAAGAGGRPDHVESIVARDAAAALARLADGVEGADVLPPVVSNRAPWRAILDTADRIDADLVVIGSHGYGGFDPLLGTTAGKVVNHARRNVLVVHRDPDATG